MLERGLVILRASKVVYVGVNFSVQDISAKQKCGIE